MVITKWPNPLLERFLAPTIEFSIRATHGATISNFMYAMLLGIACLGGFGHGVAMAIKKKFGEGIEKYWLEWKWWVGNILDALSGICIWPAMPYVSVQIFVPLIIVIQLATSYVLGLLVFKERCQMRRNLGMSLAALGVIGISYSTSHEAADFTIAQFWAGWVNTRFVTVNLALVGLLALGFPVLDRTTFWALCAAASEGIQYICSRAIVDSVYDHMHEALAQPAVLAAFVIKGMCILSIIHCQQLGLESDLSRFAGMYLVACVMFTCVEGWAFFGDALPLSLTFAASAFFTLSGIWLLNQKGDPSDEKADKLEPDAETGKMPQSQPVKAA